jgi:cytochrome b
MNAPVGRSDVSGAKHEVRAWDLPTRLFHWTLLTLVGCAWVSHENAAALGDNSLLWHRWNGYAILVLLVFRLIWGVVGSSTSRFSNFIRSPLATLTYARQLLRGRPLHYLGHNPMGTWMIIALFSALLVQGGLGLFVLDHNDIVAGPLQGTISDELAKLFGRWHRFVFKVIVGLAIIHMLANALYGVFANEPLVQAMVTGKKPAQDYVDASDAVIVPNANLRALVCLIAATAIVFGGIKILGGVL